MNILPSFSQPWTLLLLPLLPALLWWKRRRGQGTMFYSNVDLLIGLPSGRSPWARHGGWILRLLGLTCIIIALAGPRWPDRTRIPTEGIALAMVVDCSGSMGNEDFLWDNQKISRLEGVKKLFRLFIEGGDVPDGSKLLGRPQDLVSFVKFAKYPTTVCPLTLDHAVLLKNLNDLKAQNSTNFKDDGTNPGDALALAIASLRKAPVKRKVIIFLTDGESNVGGEALLPRQAAQLADGIPIYAIDANPEGNTDEETEAARKMLEDVARITNGRYFRAGNAHALAEVCTQIDQLERAPIDSFIYKEYYDGFLWFALAGLVTWLNIVLLEATLWRKVP
jgi:Ca-activated chloride channel family protein